MSSPSPSPSRRAQPRAVPVPDQASSPRGRHARSEDAERAVSTARLASPVPTAVRSPSPSAGQPSGSQPVALREALDGAKGSSPTSGPGQSALAAAFQGSSVGTPPRYGTPPRMSIAPIVGSGPVSHFGSFDARSFVGSISNAGPMGNENLEVVKRHLVQGNGDKDSESDDPETNNQHPFALRGEPTRGDKGGAADNEEFSSLQLQGGDMTRHIYRWTEDMEAHNRGRAQRSKSFNLSRPHPESETADINTIKVPGGFRRDFLRREVENASPSPAGRANDYDPSRPQPQILTNNFLEFLSLFGHFAGEELQEDDEILLPGEFFGDDDEEADDYFQPGERTSLLRPETPGWKRRQRKERGAKGTNGTGGAILLLLKSFVGTGVLFLPKAFLNGGMLFSNLVLLLVATLSFYCFILLVNTRMKVEGSFGDIGGALYGPFMRKLILFSIVLSQIGFAAAYIVFTSENLQAFVLAVSHCRTYIDIKYIIMMQLIIFLPLSLWRDISKLGATALVADVLILLGLIYLYYYDVWTIASFGVADIKPFNPKDWTLFIGTAIFTFEGIGLIIPIQESMKKQERFPAVLGGVMILITIVFISMGALSYAAYGSQTKTVVILNLPQDDKFVNAVQFLYSLAILLSTPLQLFPAIRIMENGLFTKSGKYNPYIKWQKNVFRFCTVLATAAIAWAGAGDLDKFVALIGSFACVPLVYVYPPLLHLKAVARKRWQIIVDWFFVVFGIVVMSYTTALTVKSWAGSSAPPERGAC